ncbi:hypothetical protein KL86PLE_30033 [uncultured Pleomorphomonas sp.]|uniref:Uncharacterized protein n=1 Tax=uncultured Pleomorphomonas sp. TaxID=442121 RepID=A0A212LDE2_9HYPH|nr:hypothetical protein KL86PLE_30033 [uncultured Pleomorphomonas sp.]
MLAEWRMVAMNRLVVHCRHQEK